MRTGTLCARACRGIIAKSASAIPKPTTRAPLCLKRVSRELMATFCLQYINRRMERGWTLHEKRNLFMRKRHKWRETLLLVRPGEYRERITPGEGLGKY